MLSKKGTAELSQVLPSLGARPTSIYLVDLLGIQLVCLNPGVLVDIGDDQCFDACRSEQGHQSIETHKTRITLGLGPILLAGASTCGLVNW